VYGGARIRATNLDLMRLVLNRVTVYIVEDSRRTRQLSRGVTAMTAAYGMMAMIPLLFVSAGYVLVSSGGTSETAGRSRFQPISRSVWAHAKAGDSFGATD
jgi:hypothetical protein